MTREPCLNLEHVAVGYGRRTVLPDVHLLLPRGSFTGLVGANGTGKSTLIKTILGIIPPLAGRVTFVPHEGRSAVVGYTPQRDALDPIYLLSGFEVVLMGACGRVPPGRRFPAAERDWARTCLREAGAEAFGDRLFSELSGGQKQRVLMARALATRPDFLLLDEPTSGVDTAARQAIMDVLRRIHRQQGMTILLASHDLPAVRAYVEDVIWLHERRVLHGPVGEMLTPEKIEEILDLEMH